MHNAACILGGIISLIPITPVVWIYHVLSGGAALLFREVKRYPGIYRLSAPAPFYYYHFPLQ